MQAPHTEAVETAAGYVLKAIAEEPGRLFRVLQSLGFERPNDPVNETPGSLVAKVYEAVPQACFDVAWQRTGVRREQMVRPLLLQLRHVAMFATSPNGVLPENVRAAEELVRSGSIAMFEGT